MNAEDFENQLIDDALGLLPDAQSAVLRRHVSQNPDKQALAAEYETLRDALVYLAPPRQVPVHLKSRILARIDRNATPPTLVDQVRTTTSFWWRIAATIIVSLCAWGIFSAQTARPIIVKDLRGPAAPKEIVLRCLTGTNQCKIAIEWDGRQQGWNLQANNLPALPAGQEYRVWVIDPTQDAPVSCGTLPSTASGPIKTFIQPEKTVQAMQGFAITVESTNNRSEPGRLVYQS